MKKYFHEQLWRHHKEGLTGQLVYMLEYSADEKEVNVRPVCIADIDALATTHDYMKSHGGIPYFKKKGA